MPFNIDKSLKKILHLPNSRFINNIGKGANYFSSGGLLQPFPNNFQKQKFPEIHYNNAKRVVVDGKPIYYVGNKQNAPSPRMVQKVYAKISDDKKVPIVFQTKKQYLQEYIKNQEQANNTKFTNKEKEQYIRHELKDMRPVVSRFTTYHNNYMPPRTVFFTDNKFNKDKKNFEMSAMHEYWHEKTEGDKQAQDDEVAAEQYARDRASKDRLAGIKMLDEIQNVKVEKNRMVAYHGSQNPDKVLQKGFDFSKGQFIDKTLFLSPTVEGALPWTGKRIITNINGKKEVDISQFETTQNKAAEPTAFINYDQDIINDPSTILFPSEHSSRIEELKIFTKQIDPTKVDKGDIGLNRLNKMQMERLRRLQNISYVTSPVLTPKPLEMVDVGEEFPIKSITEKPSNIFEAQVRNRAYNLMKRYPHLITEFEKTDPKTEILFYQYGGPKEKQIYQGHHGTGTTPEGEKQAITMIDVKPDKQLTGREYQYFNIAKTAFHELGHEKQYRKHPGFKYDPSGTKSELTGNEPIEEYFSVPYETEAEEYAESQITDINKERIKKLRMFLTPEEVSKIHQTPKKEFEKKKQVGELPTEEQLRQRAKEYHKQIEEQKTAGIQALEQGKDRRGWPQASHQEQLKGVESGEKPIALVATESFNNNYIDTSLPYLELPFNKKYPHMGHQRIYYPSTQEGIINAQRVLSIINKDNITEQEHRELGKLFGYENDEIENFLWALKNNQPLYQNSKVINYKIDKNRTLTTDDFLPTVQRGIRVESTAPITFNFPQTGVIDIQQKPLYISGKFQDLFKHGEHIQIVNPIRNEVTRDIRKVGNVARITPGEGETLDIPLETDILYEPWMMDRGSLVFHAPANASPGLQNQLLKIATEEDEVRIVGDEQTKNWSTYYKKRFEEQKKIREARENQYRKRIEHNKQLRLAEEQRRINTAIKRKTVSVTPETNQIVDELFNKMIEENPEIQQEIIKRSDRKKEIAKKWKEENSEKVKESAKKYYANMSPEQKEAQLQRVKEWRASMTPEQKEAQLQRVKEWRANMSPEQKEEYLQRRIEWQRIYYANQTPEQRKIRLERQRERNKERYANMSPEQREEYLQREKERHTNITSEQKEQSPQIDEQKKDRRLYIVNNILRGI